MYNPSSRMYSYYLTAQEDNPRDWAQNKDPVARWYASFIRDRSDQSPAAPLSSPLALIIFHHSDLPWPAFVLTILQSQAFFLHSWPDKWSSFVQNNKGICCTSFLF